MLRDRENCNKANYVAKHRIQLKDDRFWLRPQNEVDVIAHPSIPSEQLIAENRKCWDTFYSVTEVIRRLLRKPMRRWRLGGKFTYLLLCVAFRRIYGGQGMVADGVRTRSLGRTTRTIIKIGIASYNHHFRQHMGSVGRPWARPELHSDAVPGGSSIESDKKHPCHIQGQKAG